MKLTLEYDVSSIKEYESNFKSECYIIAYFAVYSLAVCSYAARSVLYCFAISGTKGSSGFGSVSRLLIESKTNSILHKVYLCLLSVLGSNCLSGYPSK